jgi:cold shock CspA family protein
LAAVFNTRQASLFGFVQNLLLNVVEFAFSPRKPRKWANFNNNTYRNFEYEDWEHSFTVKQGLKDKEWRPDGGPIGRFPHPEASHIGNFLLRVMHLRPHGDSIQEDSEVSNDKIAAIVENPLTKYVIRFNLLAFRRRTEEEERRVGYEIEMDYERLLAAEFDRLPSVLTRNKDSEKGESAERTEEAVDNVEDEEDFALFRPFMKRESSLEALDKCGQNDEGDFPNETYSRRQSEDMTATESDPALKDSPIDPQMNQKKTKTKLVFRKAKEFLLPQTTQTPQTADSYSTNPSSEIFLSRPMLPPSFDQPTYQIQASFDPEMAQNSNSYITPFFGSDEDISHNRIFTNLVSKLSTSRSPSTSEVLDPNLYFGHLKFFDDRNNFGFISTLVNGLPEDIFAYGSEFDERVQFHPMFRNPKLGQHILFQFNICTYFGKYKKSKKAMNIRVVDGVEF